MRRATAREEQDRRQHDRFASTLVIAAAIIAAVRLGRGDIGLPSPHLTSVVADSVGLARMILNKIRGVSMCSLAATLFSLYWGVFFPLNT